MDLLLGAIGVGVAVLLWKSFLPSYVSEKAKNLATKEDIAAITQEVEKVKAIHTSQLKELEHQNALLLEQLRSKNQLRMAALEKRLDAHQHAFTLWRLLLERTHSGDVVAIANECQYWWERNCLYLSADARLSFNKAYFAALHYKAVMNDPPNPEVALQYMQYIKEAGSAIVAGVELPSLGEREAQSVSSVAVA
jgi:hypothetical protein